MRKILIILLVLSIPSMASASWVVNNTSFQASMSTGQTLVVGNSVHDTIYVGINAGTSPGTVTSLVLVSATCATAFAKVVGIASGGFDSEIWSASDCPASAGRNLTVNFSGGGTMYVTTASVSGSSYLAYTTNTSNGASSGTSKAGPAVTTVNTGDFVFSTFDPAHTITGVDAAWQPIPVGIVGNAYLASNTAVAGSYAPTWTININGAWVAATAAFGPASFGGVPRKHGTFIKFKPDHFIHRLPWVTKRNELRIETI